jgi:hypothetical protein
VDFFAVWHEEQRRFSLLCAKTQLSDFDSERWNNASPAECQAALESKTTLQPLDDDPDAKDEKYRKAGYAAYLLPPAIQLPLTLAFRTGEGIAGLMQVTGYNASPRGVKIRYKLAWTEKN